MVNLPRILPLPVLLVAALSCGRETPASSPDEPTVMRPASGQATPSRGKSRRGCAENFAAFDDNNDGRVSEDEFMARPHPNPEPLSIFRDRDSDADGELTEAEFCTAWHRGSGAMMHRGGGGMHGPMQGPMHSGPMHSGPMHSGPMPHRMGTRCDHHFMAFDANEDGGVTLQEFGAWPHARGDAEALFRERDANQDGKITRSEFCSSWSR